ncbi:MAG: glycosyltransferase family 1 protein [Bacteroidales bacterium]|jgi:glycosyltransferase involved in cell wall biosynthesis|nr:glycosyltransferase family 1 protein [Bacteroidales bacterium]
MRIGFDAKRAFYNRSGLGNYSRDTINSLMSYYPEHDYYLYTPKKKDPISFGLKGSAKIIQPQGISRFYQSYWRSMTLGSKISRDKLDIYHGLSNELPANIVHSETRKVVTIHDLIFMRYPELYKSVDREIYQQKFFEASLAADKIIAISEQTKEDIISFFHIPENKIDVIYQGCNPIFYEKKSKEAIQGILKKYKIPEKFILSVGTLERRKNALHVLEGLKQSALDIPVVFVGKSTNYIKTLQEYIRENDMKNQVIFRHNIPSNDLPAIYQAAKIFIYPSLFEGFGIPILEALNSGTPVITNKYGCFLEAGGDAAIYVNPNHPEEIGASIHEIIESPEKAEKMKKTGLEYAKKFTQEKIAKQLIDLYKSLI